MTSAIGGSAKAQYVPSAPIASQKVVATARDSDGDNDGSKVGEVEKAKTIAGNVGTIVNTTA